MSARVVVGLLVHTQPGRVRELLRALASDDIAVVLHVDRKCPYDPADFLPDERGSVVVSERRMNVWWGHVNIVDATLETMRIARGLDAEWFSLASGACTPTRAPAEIVQRLCRPAAPSAHLDASPLPRDVWRSGGYERVTRFHLQRPLPRGVRRLVDETTRRLPDRRVDRFPPLYGGSAWFDLRGDVLGWVLEHLRRHPDYRRAFRLTGCADELFFQTLLLASPYADELHVVNDGVHRLYGLRYIDWGSGGRHPAILDAASLERARSEDCIFARKTF